MAADEPDTQMPPPPPEPKEKPVPSTTTASETVDKPKAPEGLTAKDFHNVEGPVTDTKVTVAEGEEAVEAARMRFFHGTRQGTEAHEQAKADLASAQANLRVARRARRY